MSYPELSDVEEEYKLTFVWVGSSECTIQWKSNTGALECVSAPVCGIIKWNSSDRESSDDGKKCPAGYYIYVQGSCKMNKK